MALCLKISNDKMCLYKMPLNVRLCVFTRVLLRFISFFNKRQSPSEKQVQ